MSIKNTIRIINRVNAIVTDLQAKYTSKSEASHELNKLKAYLAQLLAYINKLDQLAPNYSTDEVDNYINSINVNLAILQGEMEPVDYKKLAKAVKALKTMLKFHPVKYSFFTFIIAWFVELIYFI
jgi:hypothetical protein